jgi:hypothetical protein
MEVHFTPSSGYAIVMLGLVIILVLYLTVRFVFRWIASLVSQAILKYIVYSTISFFSLLDKQPSVTDLLFTVVYITANAICIGWNIKSTEELSSRCASLLITNLIVLLPSASVASDMLQISLRSYQKAHSIIGMVALTEGSVHAALELVRHEWKGGTVTVTGLAVSITRILGAYSY